MKCAHCSLQAQAAAVRQVGRGGLNEQAGSSGQDPSGVDDGPAGVQRRGDATAVSTAEIVRHPSEAEQVLRILAAQLRALKHLNPQTGIGVWYEDTCDPLVVRIPESGTDHCILTAM